MTTTDRIGGLSAAIAIKAPCRVATTAAITLAGLQSIDGIALSTGDRVLVKNQADAKHNGIYGADSSAWWRAKDFNGVRDTVTGTLVGVNEGVANGNSIWRVTTAVPIVFGTSDLTFEMSSNQLAGVSAFMSTVLNDLSAAEARTTLGAGTGDASGPASSTDNVWSRFDGTDGNTLQNGTWAEDDTGNVTAGGSLSMDDNGLSRANLFDTSYEVNALGDLGGGADDIDYRDGHVVTATISTGPQTLTFSNYPAGYGAIVLFLTDGGSQTITWPDTVSAAPINLTASGVDKLLIESPDSGTTHYVTVLGYNI